MKIGLVVLGIGLGILWIVGLQAGVSGWLVWLDFAAACLSLLTVLAPDRALGRGLRASPLAVGAGLVLLWIIALAVGAAPWFAWWTLAFGIAYIILGAVGPSEEGLQEGGPTVPTMTGPRPA